MFSRDCKEVELDGKGSDAMLQEQLYQASLKWIKTSHEAIGEGDTSDLLKTPKEKENTSNESKVRSRKMERVEI